MQLSLKRNMLQTVFTKTLRDQIRPMTWLTIGTTVLLLYIVLLYPTIRDSPDLSRFVEELPEPLKAILGAQDFASAAGYLRAETFSLMIPLIFIIFGVVLGANAIAGEEEKGTLDLLLANPLRRQRVVVDKFLALCVLVLALGIVALAVLWAGATAINMDIGADKLAAAMLGSVLIGILFGALALAIGASTGQRSLALSIPAAFALASYLLNSMAPLADWLEPYRVLSPFYYYLGTDPLIHGFDPVNNLVLLVAALVLAAVAVVTFERRDLRV